MLTLKNICKQYGKVMAVHDITLDIRPGEFCTLLGPSGCGKTTLLRLIAGLEVATSGTIFMDGIDVSKTTPFERPIGLVFQSYALFPHMTVFQNIGYGLSIQKKSKEEIKSAVQLIADTLSIGALLQRGIHQLSGGQQQRVALARALIMKPKVLLFDEPLSNLDAKLRRSVREEIKQIHRQFHMTSIYVTHDQSEALSLADRIVLMKDGNVMQIGPPEEMYEHPANLFTANFLGEANLLPSDNGMGKILVRPEKISLHRTQGQLSGKLIKRSYLGWCYEYTFQTPFGEMFVIDTQMKEIFTLGEMAYLSFPQTQVIKVSIP